MRRAIQLLMAFFLINVILYVIKVGLTDFTAVRKTVNPKIIPLVTPSEL